MTDAEFAVGNAGLDIEGAVTRVGIVELGQQTLVCALGEATLFVDEREDTELALDEIEALAVVNPGGVSHLDSRTGTVGHVGGSEIEDEGGRLWELI